MKLIFCLAWLVTASLAIKTHKHNKKFGQYSDLVQVERVTHKNEGFGAMGSEFVGGLFLIGIALPMVWFNERK